MQDENHEDNYYENYIDNDEENYYNKSNFIRLFKELDMNEKAELLTEMFNSFDNEINQNELNVVNDNDDQNELNDEDNSTDKDSQEDEPEYITHMKEWSDLLEQKLKLLKNQIELDKEKDTSN